MNDASTRPLISARFSDVYLIAAEAYFKMGDNTDAATMLNVVKAESCTWNNQSCRICSSSSSTAHHSTQQTLDFILDERPP